MSRTAIVTTTQQRVETTGEAQVDGHLTKKRVHITAHKTPADATNGVFHDNNLVIVREKTDERGKELRVVELFFGTGDDVFDAVIPMICGMKYASSEHCIIMISSSSMISRMNASRFDEGELAGMDVEQLRAVHVEHREIISAPARWRPRVRVMDIHARCTGHGCRH